MAYAAIPHTSYGARTLVDIAAPHKAPHTIIALRRVLFSIFVISAIDFPAYQPAIAGSANGARVPINHAHTSFQALATA